MGTRQLKCFGFTLFEFAVSAAVLAVLAGMLLARLALYQEQAERVAVDHTVGALRTALEVRAVATAEASGRAGLARLVEENPFDWLSRKPENYSGEYYSPELEKIPAGNWVFDRRDKCLIYLLNSHKTFAFGASKFLKFKVKFVELPQQAERRNGSVRGPQGVMLDQVSDQVSVDPD